MSGEHFDNTTEMELALEKLYDAAVQLWISVHGRPVEVVDRFLAVVGRADRLRVELLELQRENDRLREFIAALPAPPASRHFEEFRPCPESIAAWEGVDPDKWLAEIRGSEVLP